MTSLPRLELDPNEKVILQIREDVPTQPLKANIESTGRAYERQIFFRTDNVELPSEEQL